MSGINKVILIGNLGKDPEIRYLEGNFAHVSFSLATTETYKDKEGKRIDHTEWHTIVLWRGLAENAHKLLRKGMQVYVEGKLQTRQWQDKENNRRQTTEIVCEHFLMMTKRENNSTEIKQNISPITSTSKDNLSGNEGLKGDDVLPF